MKLDIEDNDYEKLKNLFNERNYNVSELIKEDCLKNILKDFKSESSKRIVILELMILIHIDHSFNLNEKILIQKISDSFGIDISDVNDYSQWGKSVAMLYEVAKIFINEKNI